MYIVVFSDIHAIYPAFKAFKKELEHLENKGITIDRLWFLGDVLGYGPHPPDVLSKMIRLLQTYPNSIALLGNHDQGVLDAIDGNLEETVTIGERSISGGLFKGHALDHIRGHAKLLTSDLNKLKWLLERPPQAIAIEDAGYLLAHGEFKWDADNDIDRLWTYGTENTIHRQIQIEHATSHNPSPTVPIRLIMNGHYHAAGMWRMCIQENTIQEEEITDLQPGTWFDFDQLADRPLLINPGSVSLPREAGYLQCATYVLLEVDPTNYDKIRVQFRVMRYDTSDLLSNTGSMSMGYSGRGIIQEQIQRTLNCTATQEKEN